MQFHPLRRVLPLIVLAGLSLAASGCATDDGDDDAADAADATDAADDDATATATDDTVDCTQTRSEHWTLYAPIDPALEQPLLDCRSDRAQCIAVCEQLGPPEAGPVASCDVVFGMDFTDVTGHYTSSSCDR